MKVKFLGDVVNTNKDPMNVGEVLPEFEVLNSDNNKVTSDDLVGKPALILTVPDIDSDVCSLETKKFNRKADKYNNIKFYTISKNTVDEQKNWCAAKGVKNMQLLSDIDNDFGNNTGTYVPQIKALARMVFAIDSSGKIIYRQVVPEIGSLPDFKEVESVLEKMDK